MNDIKSRLFTGGFWLSASRGLTTALQFISTIVLARLLVPEDFGIVALATTMLAILSSATSISMGSALVQRQDLVDEHLHTSWTLEFLRGLILAALFCAAAPLAAWAFEKPQLEGLMYVLGAGMAISGLMNPKRVILQKHLVFKQDFYLDVSQRLAGVVVSIAIALIYQSYWAIAAGTVVGQLVNVVLSYAVVPFLPRFSLAKFRDLWSFSIWLTFGSALTTLGSRIDQLLIGSLLSPTALGFYTVGDKLAAAPSREIARPMTAALFPALALISREPERLVKGYQKAQAIVTAVALPAGMGTAAIAAPLVELAMGEKWAPAVPIIQILAATLAIQTIGLLQPLAMALGETKRLFQREALILMTRMPFILLGLYFGGLLGLVWARAFTSLAATAMNLHLVRVLIGVSIRDQLANNLRALLATAVMVGVVLGLQQVLAGEASAKAQAGHLLLMVGCGAIAYALTSIALWQLSGRPQGLEAEVYRFMARGRSSGR